MSLDIHSSLYQFFTDLPSKYHPRDWTWDYRNGEPVPFLVIDNFLPEEIFQVVARDLENLPSHLWTEFTRNGSYMKECKSFRGATVLQTLAHCFNSGSFVDWIESVTGKDKVIPDPHLVGAGVSVTGQGASLKLHTDFNWNDEIALNRTMSLILYINETWEEDWGGALEFWSFDRKQCLHKILPKANRLLMWHYDERLWHGYPEPLRCPNDQSRVTMRIFYYQSNAAPLTTPHRSLYWYDPATGEARDDRTQK